MGISWRVLHLAALVGSAVFSRDGSASRKAKDLSRVLHFSLRSIIRPSCRALQKHSALPFRRKCHVLRSCHFSGMTPLRVPAKQDHYHPSRQRPRKGQQGGSGDRQVSQSGKPLLRRSLRSLNLPAGRCPLGSPGRVFHPCIRNTQKCSTSGERSTGPSVMCFAISVRGLPALCTPRQERCPCIPPKGLHPFGIPQLPARRILSHNAIWTDRARQSRKQFMFIHKSIERGDVDEQQEKTRPPQKQGCHRPDDRRRISGNESKGGGIRTSPADVHYRSCHRITDHRLKRSEAASGCMEREQQESVRSREADQRSWNERQSDGSHRKRAGISSRSEIP